MTNTEILIFKHALHSVLEWESENLEADFVTHISEVAPEVDHSFSIHILREYFRLPALERENANFGFHDFFTNALRSYRYI